MDADGSNARLLFDGHAVGLVPQYVASGGDPGVLYMAAIDRAGHHAFYALPMQGGVLRRVLFFEDPSFQPRRPEFDTDGRQLYFTIASDESDVWMLELRRR
jgi:hypothetical protein